MNKVHWMILAALGLLLGAQWGCSESSTPAEPTPPEPPKSGYVYTFAGNGVEGYR